ncbi:MAG: hypothetical protein QNK04_27615 [Myxococcota bacterium]|nr:hypothetical protein [Myxococcota bacterium]
MSNVFGGDTYPNKWYAEYAKGADVAIHECFIAVPDMIEKFKFTPQSALAVGTQIHTAPEAFGKMMSIIEPRMAIAYHFFNDLDLRLAKVDEDVWPPPATDTPQKPDPTQRIPHSDMISSGRYDMRSVIQPTYDEINEKYGLDEEQE